MKHLPRNVLRFLTNNVWLVPIILAVLINQYTWLAFFDLDGYLAYEQRRKFWVLDASLVLLALLLYANRASVSNFLFAKIEKTEIFKVGLITLVLFMVVDVTVVRHYAGVTQSHLFVDEKTARTPVPYIGFTGQPNISGHNEDGFLGRSIKTAGLNALRIAFFGGSTGYIGDPTIAEGIENYLTTKGIPAEVYNFSVISSNHRQHLHSLVENVLPYGADIVIFYGGYNETIQHGYYDPRPGYPYNFFFEHESSDWARMLMMLSGTAQLLERSTGRLTGLNQLRREQSVFSPEWKSRIVVKYLETLVLARKVTLATTPVTLTKGHFLAFYQPYKVTDELLDVHEEVRKRAAEIDYLFDVSTAYDELGKDVFLDIVHVKQSAKDHMAMIISEKLLAIVGNDMRSNRWDDQDRI